MTKVPLPNLPYGPSQVWRLGLAGGHVLSQQAQEYSGLATAIKDCAMLLMRSSAIQTLTSEEALQVIADIAMQAETKPEARPGEVGEHCIGFSMIVAWPRCDHPVGQYAPVSVLRYLTSHRSI